MKKKILSLLLAICMILPCVFMLNACGEKDNSLDYLAFTLLEDGTYSVALKDEYRVWHDFETNMPCGGEKKFDLVDKKIKIPSEYQGQAVTQIAYSGFSDAYMSSVEIPSSITVIGEYAFSSSFMKGRVVLPDGLKTVCSGAFSYMQDLESVVVPASVEHIGSGAFYGFMGEKEIPLYYKGTLATFNEIKGVYQDWQTGVLEYSSEQFMMDATNLLYIQAEDLTNITDYISADKKVDGVWKYNNKNQIESVAIEYSDTVNGNTYAYTNSEVTLTDEYWQMLLSAKAQGMLEMVLEPAQVTMFNESANKEEFATKLATLNATVLQGMRVVFADGKFTLWQGETQYSQPLDYVEVNSTVYYNLRGVYTKAYVIENGKIVEDNSTEYGGAKHYYTEQAQ